jgi:hypothetical protein
MSTFQLELNRPADGTKAYLWLRGTEVGEWPRADGVAGGGRAWDTGNPVAACAAFERRLRDARGRGFVIQLPEEPPWADALRLVQAEPDEPAAALLLAEAMGTAGPFPTSLELDPEERLARFGQLEAAARALPGTLAYWPRAHFIRLAQVADADAVGLADGLMPPLRAVDPAVLGFDPRLEPLAPHALAVHALRRLLLHPVGRFVAELHLEVCARLEPLVEVLHELSSAGAVTRLTLEARPERPLARALPGLQRLRCPASLVERCLAEPLVSLSSLVVGVRGGAHEGALCVLGPERLPSLEHLCLVGGPLNVGGAEASARLAVRFPRLRTFELALGGPTPTPTPSPSLERLATARAELGRIEELILPAAGVSAADRARFADWPNVRWSSGEVAARWRT